MQTATLEQVIDRNLFKMLARRLDFSPSHDDLPATCAVWLEDLNRVGLTDADADRVEEAFAMIGPRAHKFPAPADLLEAMKKRQNRVVAMFPRATGDRVAADGAFKKIAEMFPQFNLKHGNE